MSKKELTAAERFANLGQQLQDDGRLQADRAKLDLSEMIYDAMQSNRITEAELARRLGASRAYVNKVLQGDTNFTVESLVKIGLAIGYELKIDLAPPGVVSGQDSVEISYVVEEPIPSPTFEPRNVVRFDDYKASKTIKVATTASDRQEGQRYAAV